MVGPGRVELPTSRLSGVRSNHLSYEPISQRAQPNIESAKLSTNKLVELRRVELLTPSLQS
jgi:hypothetical protein